MRLLILFALSILLTAWLNQPFDPGPDSPPPRNSPPPTPAPVYLPVVVGE